MRLFPLFLLWPLAEIMLFVVIGGRIGLLATLAVILGTGVLGVWLLRSRGVRSAGEFQRGLKSIHQRGFSGVAGDILLMAAALLLILPGFLTDILGAVLLIAPLRKAFARLAERKFLNHIKRQADHLWPDDGPSDFRQRPGTRPDIVIDGEYLEVEPDPHRPPSGWTRH